MRRETARRAGPIVLCATRLCFRRPSWPSIILCAMKRTFAIPFIAALLGGGVVVAVIAAVGGIGSSHKTVTTIQAAPLAPSNASQQSSGLTPHDIYVRDAPGVAFVTSTVVQKSESPFNLFGGEAQRQGQDTGSGIA